MRRSDIDKRIQNLGRYLKISMLEHEIHIVLMQAVIKGKGLTHYETNRLQSTLLELKRLRSQVEPMDTNRKEQN